MNEKYVFRVCFESPFMRMISSLKYKWPPGHWMFYCEAPELLKHVLPNQAKLDPHLQESVPHHELLRSLDLT